ncbi:unnamed protein product [Paramecium primaurelia]|uniref:Uncharacterized protein n=1 Tax=Paramecium primaurelia TaxID=5886 RepID=A0A8S1MIT2_PARPR|nr:unnamed protein product [Paramecium primaurelia]
MTLRQKQQNWKFKYLINTKDPSNIGNKSSLTKQRDIIVTIEQEYTDTLQFLLIFDEISQNRGRFINFLNEIMIYIFIIYMQAYKR